MPGTSHCRFSSWEHTLEFHAWVLIFVLPMRHPCTKWILHIPPGSRDIYNIYFLFIYLFIPCSSAFASLNSPLSATLLSAAQLNSYSTMAGETAHGPGLRLLAPWTVAKRHVSPRSTQKRQISREYCTGFERNESPF